MKNLLRSKLFIGIGVVVLIVVVLVATGAMNFSFKVSKTGGGEEGTEGVAVKKAIEQKQELMTKETTFEAAGGEIKMAIKLPVGWSLGTHEELEFVAGSQLPEKLANGGTFTVNLNASGARHPEGVSSFADYQSSYKDALLGGNPSLEEVASESIVVDGVDVYVVEMRNTRPDGVVAHQIQHVYYLNDDYYVVATATAPEEFWGKYSQVLRDSLGSMRLVEVVETSAE